MNKKAQTFLKVFTKFTMFSIFFLGILSMAFIVQTNNSASQPLSEDSLFNRTSVALQKQISDTEASEIQQQSNFDSNTESQTGTLSIIIPAIIGVGKTTSGLVNGFFTVLFEIPKVVLGIDSLIISSLLSILILTLVIGAWVLYKLGG